MLRGRKKILVGIVLLSSVSALAPEIAYAEDVCNAGSVDSGASQSFTFTLDSSVRAQFILDTLATDVSMSIVDSTGAVACKTSLPNPGHQSCGWMPSGDGLYTVDVTRTAAATPVVSTSSDDEDAAPANIGQGTIVEGDVSNEPDTSSGDDSTARSASGSWSGRHGRGHRGGHGHHHHDHDSQGSGEPDNQTDDEGNQAGDDNQTGGDTGNGDGVTPVSAPMGPPVSFTLCSIHVN